MLFNVHSHTEYSNALLGFPDVVNKVDELIDKAYEIGLAGLAITEHEGISSHVVATKYYQGMNLERPFKLALGNEIYLMTEEESNNNRDSECSEYTPYYHAILVALDEEGHRQIRQLSSRAWIRAYTYKGLMRRPTFYSDIEEVIGENKGHLIFSTACLGSYIDKQILKWKQAEEEGKPSKEYKLNIDRFIKWGINTFGKENFYLEIQPCLENNKEQQIVNEAMWQLSQVYGLKIIPSMDAHYLSKDTAFVHKTYLNSKEGDREVDDFYATAYLMSADEMREYLRLTFADEQIDIMFENSMDIFNRVQIYSLNKSPMIPQIPEDKIPSFKIKHLYKDYYDKYEEFKFYAYHTNLQDQYFFYRIEHALNTLIEPRGKNIDEYINRLNNEFRELRIISEAFNDSMASYYTSMSKIVELIWEADSLSMPARGSGAGFLVCYLLEITQIDPVPLGDYFPFWRHLSHERGVEIADIDNDSQKSRKEAIVDKIKDFFGEDRVLNVATFTKLTSKTAIEKSVKGLKLNDDMGAFLKSLIPVERGAIWSLKDCIHGNEEKGRKPVKELINEMNKYEHLMECALALEGLVVNRGMHPAGVVIGNEPYTESIACMRTPTGTLTTCYELHDSEYCSQTKVDMLTIIASDKIRVAMDLLIKYGHMKWQGSLKETYWKYLHPDVLDYDNKEMWGIINKVYSVFQFDTPVSVQALKATNPQSIMDISATNSLLRLMAQDGKESPLQIYKRYKDDINEWYKDMTEYGLNQDEQQVLVKYLSNSYGLADSQEKVMLISMDKNVAGFTLKESNKLRKSIAKKNPKVLEETMELFYNSCKLMGTRDVFAKYVWEEVFAKSFGYSFSQLHSYSYSVIALQELQLNYYYPPVYWNCACLTVEGQCDEGSTKGGADYGKIAKSIYKMKSHDIVVSPPDINTSDLGFTPVEADNTIKFGLAGMSGINQDIAKEIIEGRPYTSFKQFYDYHKNAEILCGVDEDGGKIYRKSSVTKSKIITLIKAGCFDCFNPNRVALMKWLAVYETGTKDKLSTSNLPKCIELGVDLPKDLVRAYKFKKYVCNKEFFYCQNATAKSKKDYMLDDYARGYFEDKYMDKLKEEIDYYYIDDNIVVVDKSLEKAMKDDLDKLKECLNDKSVIDDFNKKNLQLEYKNMVEDENINKWAFDAICFYDKEHELANTDLDRYNVVSFDDLPEEPTFEEYIGKGGKVWKRYHLSRICGTVLGRNDNNHLVDILTPDDNVVTLNIPQGQFGFYKKVISEVVDGKKTVIEDSWLKRGCKIMVCGYRRGDAFFVKRYAKSLYQHSIALIDSINQDGTLDLKLERYNPNEEE